MKSLACVLFFSTLLFGFSAQTAGSILTCSLQGILSHNAAVDEADVQKISGPATLRCVSMQDGSRLFRDVVVTIGDTGLELGFSEIELVNVGTLPFKLAAQGPDGPDGIFGRYQVGDNDETLFYRGVKADAILGLTKKSDDSHPRVIFDLGIMGLKVKDLKAYFHLMWVDIAPKEDQ